MDKGDLGCGKLSPACGETASQFQVEPTGSPLLIARYAWRCFCGQLSRNSVLGSPGSRRAGCGEAQPLGRGILVWGQELEEHLEMKMD